MYLLKLDLSGKCYISPNKAPCALLSGIPFIMVGFYHRTFSIETTLLSPLCRSSTSTPLYVPLLYTTLPPLYGTGEGGVFITRLSIRALFYYRTGDSFIGNTVCYHFKNHNVILRKNFCFFF
ncbi:unnamed protein product [Meloidogyne enterolobii]|uniref:Uncharacterized protein n=1 Tax=Meloidogyne enterolobii TaxID=390850 RepID=A0ACB1B6F3_MELEN